MARFADILKKYRYRAGLTQQQLGDRLRLSSPYIAQIESGLKPPPSPDLVERIGQVLRVSDEEMRGFLDLARNERGHQSLIKATKKLGYALAGNNVLVPEVAITSAIRGILTDMFEEVRDQAERGAFVGGLELAEDFQSDEIPPILRHRDEMLTW
ncbi:MAG: helix-turn-helix transcriptional regulator, partial [bacterium]